MNTSALKTFAPAVHKQLMEAVTLKLDYVLTAQTPDYLATYARQVKLLRELETAASPWSGSRASWTTLTTPGCPLMSRRCRTGTASPLYR